MARPSSANTPATKASAPAMTRPSLGEFGSMIVGLGVGGAGAIAHRVVNAVTSTRAVKVKAVSDPASNPVAAAHSALSEVETLITCAEYVKMLEKCSDTPGINFSRCHIYMVMLLNCRDP